MVSMTAELIPSATALIYSGDLPFNIDIFTNGMFGYSKNIIQVEIGRSFLKSPGRSILPGSFYQQPLPLHSLSRSGNPFPYS